MISNDKGESFELRVYKAIKEALAARKLGLDPSSCSVHHQKAYFSKFRERSIITDVSIEVYTEGGSEPSIIWIWECKDHKRSISVGHIEQLHSVLEQIGADKTKGTIICSKGAFDRSAWEYAKSTGIALARLMPDDQIYSELAANVFPIDGLFIFLLYLLDRKGRSFKEYIRDTEYEKAHNNLIEAHTNIDYESKEDKFYGLSSSATGLKNRRIITFNIINFIRRELEIDGFILQ